MSDEEIVVDDLETEANQEPEEEENPENQGNPEDFTLNSLIAEIMQP